jgi:hypothetical protein
MMLFCFSGNGPSGIALSYLLAGNWPYYNGAVHPDEMLTTRLASAPRGRSIIKQDLRFLSQVYAAFSHFLKYYFPSTYISSAQKLQQFKFWCRVWQDKTVEPHLMFLPLRVSPNLTQFH